MKDSPLNRHIGAYGAWRSELFKVLNYYRLWLEKSHLNSTETANQLELAFDRLTHDSISIALMGAASTAKTALLNGLLFHPVGAELPDTAHSCFCPMEFYYDHRNSHQIKLLPIETRLTQTSLSNFKKSTDLWVTLEFDPREPQSLTNAMSRVTEMKTVATADAIAMGFTADRPAATEGMQLIPAWRYARVNLDHVLLRQGVTLLDVPQLKQLGCEPELVFRMLDNIDSLWFILRTQINPAEYDSPYQINSDDLSDWQRYLTALKMEQHTSLFAVLNAEIATDFTHNFDAQKAATMVHELTEFCAEQLAIPNHYILFPEHGPYQNNSASNHIEKLLASNIISTKEQALAQQVIDHNLNTLYTNRKILKRRRESLLEQIAVLQNNHQHRYEALQAMETETKEDLAVYHKKLIKLKTQRKQLINQSRAMKALIDTQQLTKLRYEAGKILGENWSIVSLNNALECYFKLLNNNFNQLNVQATQAQKNVTMLYQAYEMEQGLAPMDYARLDMQHYQTLLLELQNKSSRYRRHFKSQLQHHEVTVKRFFMSISSEVAQLHATLSRAIDTWEETTLLPLYQTIETTKQLLEQQVVLAKSLINETRNPDNKTRDLHDLLNTIESHLQQADQLINAFRAPLPSST